MQVKIELLKDFVSDAKPLLKKYHSLTNELKELKEKLIENPEMGDRLFENVYKVRLAVKSKGKGKSGGLRVITFVYTVLELEKTVFLTSIYDKSEFNTVDKTQLEKIVEGIKNELR